MSGPDFFFLHGVLTDAALERFYEAIDGCPRGLLKAQILHALATRFLQAVPDANPFPRTEDTDVAGFPISREVAAQGIV